GGYITRYEWDFAPGGDYEFVSDSPLASWTFSIAGANSITLRVTDNYHATHHITLPVTLTKGWHSQTIVGNSETRGEIGMCTTGVGSDARACIAYQEYAPHDLRFVR